MTWWSISGLVAVALALGGTAYIRPRWRQARQAYQAKIVLAACYSMATLLGGWLVHSTPPSTLNNRFASISSAPQTPQAIRRITAKVVRITDGDTVTVVESDGHEDSVRLAGIDAPEYDQAFGAQSTQHLSSLISDKSVSLDCGNERSYGRLICKILLANGEDVDLDQVTAGMAWHYKQYQDEQSPADRGSYAAAECVAMKAKVGLWSDPHPVQPQDFRHDTNSPLLFDGSGCRTSSEPSSGPVVGNSRSHTFEWPGCPYYSAISADYRISFPSPQAAESAGYRPARNCP